MKTFYRLASALLISIGLTACGSGSLFEAEMTDVDTGDSIQAKAAGNAAIPEGCVSWFDGCNTCSVKEGEIGGCTKKACKSQATEGSCRAYAPGFGGNAIGAAAEEAPAPDTIPETKRDASAEVPANCKIWFDGCNSCVVQKGKLRGCTSKSCSTQDTPRFITSN